MKRTSALRAMQMTSHTSRGELVLNLALNAATIRAADWITLDLTGLITLLSCCALGVGYLLAALTFGVLATVAPSRSERARYTGRAVLCCAFAAFFGLLLPMFASALSKAAAITVDFMAIFWAPGAAAAAGFVVSRIGREVKRPAEL